MLAPTLVPMLERSLVVERWCTSEPANRIEGKTTYALLTSGVRRLLKIPPPRAREAWPPALCAQPEEHRRDGFHGYFGGGVGWRCRECEREPEGTLKERVGWDRDRPF